MRVGTLRAILVGRRSWRLRRFLGGSSDVSVGSGVIDDALRLLRLGFMEGDPCTAPLHCRVGGPARFGCDVLLIFLVHRPRSSALWERLLLATSCWRAWVLRPIFGACLQSGQSLVVAQLSSSRPRVG